jgi:hypothetical protein
MEKIKFNFKKFEKTNVRFENRITITSIRSFGFPTKFYQDNKLETYKYVVIYFDEKNKVIGLFFTNDEQEKHKFSLIKSKQGYGGGIVATSFFKTYNLDPKKYRGKYEWTKKIIPNIGKLFIISLRDKVEEKKLKRGTG